MRDIYKTMKYKDKETGLNNMYQISKRINIQKNCFLFGNFII